MKRILVFTVIALVLAGSIVYAGHGRRGGGFADPGCGMHEGRGMGMHGGKGMGLNMLLQHADEIGLDEKQQAQISGMMEEFAMERIDREAELEKAQIQLRHLQMNDGAESEVLAMIDKVGALKTEMRKMQYSHHEAIKALLTEEQLDKLQELRKDFQGRCFTGGMGGQRGTGGPMDQGRGFHDRDCPMGKGGR